MTHSLRYAVNCSLLFTELPLLDRPAAAKAAGFDAVEFWWPWPLQPVPPDAEVRSFVDAVRNAGVTLVGLNFFAGDLTGADAGVLSIPSRSQEFRDNVDVTVGIGAELQVGAFNALYGNRVDAVPAERQDELAVENLALAAQAAGRIGAQVLVEAVSGPKPYPLRTAADALAVIDRVSADGGPENLSFLCDLFHLATNGDDLDRVISACTSRIGHVQIADAPGRNEPGTGSLDLEGLLQRLQSNGYAGWVGLEYKPTGASADSFAWLPPDRRRAISTTSTDHTEKSTP
ncbi:MAG: TIM barrel protein [Nocardioidaceae bacterium]|nr:TIM barrel protein [Nocardioidaceae bacterium]